MINSYQYHSQRLQTNITISFYDGRLKSVDVEGFPENVEVGPTIKFMVSEEEFLQSAKERNIKVTKVNREITFDMFWDAYAYKSSGKQEAENAWKKLSKEDRLSAFDYIPVYEGLLKLNPVSKLYAASYLNKKRWKK